MSYRNPFLSAEARAVMAGYPTVPTERKRLIADFIRALKDTSFWAKADVLYLLAAPDQAAAIINWKAPGTHNLVASGGLTFAPDREVKGNGTSGMLEAAGYNPAAGGKLMSLNDAMLGCYTRTAASYDGSTSRLDLYSGTTGRIQRRSDVSNFVSARANDGVNIQVAVTSHVGHFSIQRSASTARALYKDGASIIADAQPSTTLSNELTVFSTGTGNWSDAGLSLAYAGAAIPAGEVEQVNAIFTQYLRSIGAV